MRLFCALRLPESVLDELTAWQAERLPERRIARSNLHVTLAFLGRRPAEELDAIVAETRAAAAAARKVVLEPQLYRETRSVGMLVLSDANGAAGRLAADLHGRLEGLGVYRRERRTWLPHVTVLRFRGRPRLAPPLPPLGAFSPSDAAVYHSMLRSTGAQYDVVESFALAGPYYRKEH